MPHKVTGKRPTGAFSGSARFLERLAKALALGAVPILTMKKPLCTDREVSHFCSDILQEISPER